MKCRRVAEKEGKDRGRCWEQLRRYDASAETLKMAPLADNDMLLKVVDKKERVQLVSATPLYVIVPPHPTPSRPVQRAMCQQGSLAG